LAKELNKAGFTSHGVPFSGGPDQSAEDGSGAAPANGSNALETPEQSREFFASLVESSEIAIIGSSLSGAVLSWNAAASRLFGYSAEEIIGKPMHLLIFSDDLVRFVNNIEKLKQGEAIPPYEILISTQNGRKVEASISLSPVRDSKAQITAIASIVRDISARKCAERTHALLASVVESSNDAILAIGLDKTILSWNHGAELVYGYTAEEMVGKCGSRVVPEEYRREHDEMFTRITNGEPVIRFQSVRRRKDGRLIDASLTYSPIYDSHGNSMGVSAVVRDITEKKAAEKASGFLAALVESSSDAIVGRTVDGLIATWNRAAEIMFGYTAEEVIGKPTLMMTTAENLALHRRNNQILKSGQSIPAFEITAVRKDGRTFPALVSASPIKDKSGQTIAASSIVRDITQLKVTEEALRASERRFQSFMSHIPGATWILDESARYVYLNAAYEKLMGLAPGTAIGKALTDFFPPAIAEEYLRNNQKALQENRPVEVLEKGIRADGSEGEFMVIKFPMESTGSNGKVKLLGGVAFDVTDSRRGEEARALLAAVVESSDDAIEVISLDQTVLSWNKGAERIFGYTAEEMVGRKIGMVVPPDRQNEMENLLDRIRSGEPVSHLETVRVCKDGRRIDVSLTVSPIKDQRGVMVGASKIARDITETKRSQQALREAEEKVHTLVENIPDVAWTVDINRHVNFVTPNVEKMLGIPAAEFYARGSALFFDAVHPEDREQASAAFAGLFLRDEVYDIECRVRRRDGTWLWGHSRALATYERNGVKYATGLLSDITPRKKAEQATRESEERYRLLFQRSLAGVFRCSQAGRLLDCNDAYANIFGYASREEMIGRDMRPLFFAAQDKEKVDQALAKSGALALEETKLRRKDGSTVWLMSNISLTHSDQGEPILEGTAIDITARKEIEEHLHFAKEAAEAASRAKSEFLPT
jgi:PAS domain S-box-containing protein